MGGQMQMQLRAPVFLPRSLPLVFGIVLNICQSHEADFARSIDFTQIPPTAQGGRERAVAIFGRVGNAPRNQ